MCVCVKYCTYINLSLSILCQNQLLQINLKMHVEKNKLLSSEFIDHSCPKYLNI